MKEFIALTLTFEPELKKKQILKTIPAMLIWQLEKEMLKKQVYILPCEDMTIEKNTLTAKWEILDIFPKEDNLIRLITIASDWYSGNKKSEIRHIVKMLKIALKK